MLVSQTMSIRFKAARALKQRVSGLLDDGYNIVFSSSGFTSDMWFVSLRHRNGNKVTMTAYWQKNQLIQRTNGAVTHEGTLY